MSWLPLMAVLGRHLRVVAYERAGLGASDPAPQPDGLGRQVGDLASVIGATSTGPCLLVGHSWGGLLAQLLVFGHPNLVAGLVLIDPAHEDMAATLGPAAGWLLAHAAPKARRAANRSGLYRVAARRQGRRLAERLAGGWQVRRVLAAAQVERAGRPDELARLVEGAAVLRALRAAAHPLPDIPIVVFSATRGAPAAMRRHWTSLQAQLAASVPQGTHIVVPGAGHAIHQERPDLVAEAVLALARRIDAAIPRLPAD